MLLRAIPAGTAMRPRRTVAVLVAATRTAALKPLASPVVIGGNNGAVTAALYGKLQRMESVFDSGLGRPALVGSEKLVRQTDKILWRAYSMASVTPGDVVPKVDFIKFRGLLGSAAPLYFVDSTGFKQSASQEKGLFDSLPNPFGGKPSSGKPKPKKPAARKLAKKPAKKIVQDDSSEVWLTLARRPPEARYAAAIAGPDRC